MTTLLGLHLPGRALRSLRPAAMMNRFKAQASFHLPKVKEHAPVAGHLDMAMLNEESLFKRAPPTVSATPRVALAGC